MSVRVAPAPAVGSSAVLAPVLECRDVSFAYPEGTEALRGVSLRIEPGEAVAIVGQNGSGKSTLVRHFNGLLRPSSGQIMLDGRDIRDLHVARLATIVGLAFQNPDRQLFSGRVRSEVEFGPRNLGIRGTELDERVGQALETVGLVLEAESNPYDLGHSRRKLLALASVLAIQTPILVLDEPTTGQDARGVACVREVVAASLAAGRTVVAISHDMRFVAECFRRVVVMRAGTIVRDGSPEDVFAETSWPDLEASNLSAPLPALVGARLGLGSTPTDAALVAALSKSRR